MSAISYEQPPAGSDDSHGADRVLTLRDILTAVRRRWWAVVATFLVVVAVGAWRTWREPHMYRAAATVRFQQQSAPISGAQMAAPRYDYRVDPLLSEQLLIKSLAVSERVVAQMGLQLAVNDPSEVRRDQLFGQHWPTVTSDARVGEYRLHLGDSTYSLHAGAVTYGTTAYGTAISGPGFTLTVPRRPPTRERDVLLTLRPAGVAAQEVRAMLSTQVLPQTDIVEISAYGPDPSLVRDVANAVARAYAAFSSEGLRASARKKTEFIEQSLRDQARQLAVAQDDLKRFKERYRTADVTAEQAALFETVQRLEAERRTALVELKIYESLLGRLSAADTLDEQLRQLAGTDAVSKNQYIANLYERWFDLTKQRESLLTSGRLPSNPDVEAVDRSITRTKGDLQTASHLYLQGLNTRLSSLDRNISDLRDQSGRYPPLEAEQARLLANVRTLQGTYDNLQEQYQIARITESADVGTVRIIDEAGLPNFAVSPKRKRAVFLAAMLGLVLGIGLAVLLERLDDSVKSPEELQERLEIPVLGLIPAIRLADVGADAATETAMSRLVTHADPRSPVAEAYRSLRTNLAFARTHQDARTMVLTSPGPSDGKSTTVANLAITFAQQGQRTLLVDADLRRAVLDKTFGVPRSPGLTDVLLDTMPLEEAVHETQVPNLFVLGSGQLPPNPSELLGSSAMRRLLGTAREQYDIVLFDSPPLLAVTDAAVLSTMVDGALLIVRMNSTARMAAQRALAHLRAVHARVMGAVLNDVHAQPGSYYGGYGYYYYAYYGSEAGQNGHTAPDGMLGRLKRLGRPSAPERAGTGR